MDNISDAKKSEALIPTPPIAPKYEKSHKMRCFIHFGEIGNSSDELILYVQHNKISSEISLREHKSSTKYRLYRMTSIIPCSFQLIGTRPGRSRNKARLSLPKKVDHQLPSLSWKTILCPPEGIAR